MLTGLFGIQVEMAFDKYDIVIICKRNILTEMYANI